MQAIRPDIQSLANGDLLSTLQHVAVSFLPGARLVGNFIRTFMVRGHFTRLERRRINLLRSLAGSESFRNQQLT